MKGQFTIISLMMIFVTLIVFAVLYPTLSQYIELAQAEMENDTTTSIMLGLIPFFIVVGIILSIIFYVIPHREE